MKPKCKWTGKASFDTANEAVERAELIRRNDTSFPWVHVYKCHHCGLFHFTRKSQSQWRKEGTAIRERQKRRIELLAEVVEARLFTTSKWIKGKTS